VLTFSRGFTSFLCANPISESSWEQRLWAIDDDGLRVGLTLSSSSSSSPAAHMASYTSSVRSSSTPWLCARCHAVVSMFISSRLKESVRPKAAWILAHSCARGRGGRGVRLASEARASEARAS
jgi:hypothetical protein